MLEFNKPNLHFMETKVTHFPSPTQIPRRVAQIGTIVVAIGAFLPWGSVDNVSITGMDGDGKITLAIAIVVLLMLFIKRISLWISMGLGALTAIIGVVQTVSLTQKIDEIKSMFASSLIGPEITGRIDFGVYLTIVGSALIVFGTFIQWIKNRKSHGNH